MDKDNKNNLDLILKENKYLKEIIFLLEEEFKKYINETNIRLSGLEDKNKSINGEKCVYIWEIK